MNKRYIKFFFGFFSIVLLIRLMLIDKHSDSENFIDLYATFNKIDGVNVGTDVMVSGIKIGNVTKISLNENYPLIKMQIDKNIIISDDSSISIQTDGLFGSKFLSIEIGGSENNFKNGNKFSFAEDSIMLSDLLNNIIKIGETKKRDTNE